MSDEHVVLVTERNEIVGTMEKYAAHSGRTPLHRAFSLFLFNDNGELLLQQRAHSKKVWPGVWSNSCCGHPMLGEKTIDAVRRRVRQELGCDVGGILEASPYRYTFIRGGIMENEICPVHIGWIKGELSLNPSEVAATEWIAWPEFMRRVTENPGQYSEWCAEEAHILDRLFSSGTYSYQFVYRGASVL